MGRVVANETTPRSVSEVTSRRLAFSLLATVAAGGAVATFPEPAGAHGVGGESDLPLDLWQFAYAATFAVLISFVALRILWPTPRLASAADGRPAPGVVDAVFRAAGLIFQVVVFGVFALTLAAAWFGVDSAARNLAPIAFYVAFWVGMQVVSVVLGDVWARVNPIATVARLFDRLGHRDAGESSATGWMASHWPAVVGLFAFLWLELAYHDWASTTAVGLFLGLYVGLMLVGAGWFSSAWLRTADGFAVVFSLFSALAPFHRVDGRLRLRWPGSGLAGVETRPGTVMVIMVLLGGVTFDGVGGTRWWRDLAAGRDGWDMTLLNTVGFAFTVAAVTAVFLVACRVAAHLAGEDDMDSADVADRWLPSFIPITFAYAVAHYFPLFVFDSQAFVRLLSDPFGRNWDLFGTADNLTDPSVLTVNQMAWVQVAAIIGGHVIGVVAARDRAVERYDVDTATRIQYPMLAVMVASAVGALFLLLNA